MAGGATLTVALLVLWGAVTGLDLVSFPQALLSRPVVIGAVSGLITGDVSAGLRVGALLELFALDVLPVGASRYPDYGAATVAATVWASGLEWTWALGPAALLGLAVGWLGGRTMELHRRRNGRRLRQLEARIAAGDPRAIAALQWRGLADDFIRATLLATLGLAVAFATRVWLPVPQELARSVTLITVAGGLVAVLTGTLRRTTPTPYRGWLVGGLAVGGLVVWLL